MSVNAALAALADPTRRALFEKLQKKGRLPVGVLAEGMDVSRPAVSQHLAVLKGAGLVAEERDGTRRFYSVDVQGVVELRKYVDQMWADALKNLQTNVKSKGR
jgi:DNA-binding transcriptional ArsR family regulator